MPHHEPKELLKEPSPSKETLAEGQEAEKAELEESVVPSDAVIITSPVTKVRESSAQLRESGTPTTLRRSVGGR